MNKHDAEGRFNGITEADVHNKFALILTDQNTRDCFALYTCNLLAEHGLLRASPPALLDSLKIGRDDDEATRRNKHNALIAYLQMSDLVDAEQTELLRHNLERAGICHASLKNYEWHQGKMRYLGRSIQGNMHPSEEQAEHATRHHRRIP